MVDNCNTVKQQRLERWGSGKLAITQNMLDKSILRFIIEDLQPLSITESPAFIDLVRSGLPSSIRIISRKTVKAKLQQAFCEMKTALKNKLAQLEIVSTTADLWSKMKRLLIYNFIILYVILYLISESFILIVILYNVKNRHSFTL